MKEAGLITLILISIVAVVWLYKVLKPYLLKYDTTLCITGGLGSGKTLTAVKTAIVLLRKQRLVKYYIYNSFWKMVNYFRKKNNKRKRLYNEKYLKLIQEGKKKAKVRRKLHELRSKPMLYSNLPIHYKTHLVGRKKEWSVQLEAPQLVLLQNMTEYSVVLIDELPQFVNQFNWNEKLIQDNVNEWITYFRHYIGGYFITTAQSVDDVVVQIRRKLNQAVWCYDFKKWFFGLFYTIRMCDIMLSDQVGTMSTTMLEENTKLHFGLFPKKGTYATRCYKNRMKNVYEKQESMTTYNDIYTNKVLRLMKYKSPLDDITTEAEKKEMQEKGEKIWKN